MPTVLAEPRPQPTAPGRWRARLARDPTQASWQVVTLFLTPALLIYALFTA